MFEKSSFFCNNSTKETKIIQNTSTMPAENDFTDMGFVYVVDALRSGQEIKNQLRTLKLGSNFVVGFVITLLTGIILKRTT